MKLLSKIQREILLFFFSSRRRHTRFDCDWSSDVCSSDLGTWRRRRVVRHIQGMESRSWKRKSRYKRDRKSTRLNSSHSQISYAVFCLKKKKNKTIQELSDRHSWGRLPRCLT